MKPDPNATQTYSNWGTDISGNNRVQLYPNASNYVYGRVETSQAVSALARMYAVPSGMLQYPSKVGIIVSMSARADPRDTVLQVRGQGLIYERSIQIP